MSVVLLGSIHLPGSQLLSVRTVEHLIKASYDASNDNVIFRVLICDMKC